MKIRNGFVSNSSSSSFCIIGVGAEIYISKLAKAEGLRFECFEDEDRTKTQLVRGCDCDIDASKGKYCPECGVPVWEEEEVEDDAEYAECGYGSCEGKVLDFIGSYEEVSYAGVHAETLLKTMSIPEACKHFQKIVKEKLNVDVPLACIGFHYGESSSE